MMINRFSAKSQFILLLLTVSLVSSLLVGLLGWRSSRNALSESIFYGMIGLRRSKAAQIEAHFRSMRYTLEILSEDDMVVEAMVRFNRAFRQLENQAIPAEWDTALENFYTSQFFPRLFANLPGQADYHLYRPQNQAGLYLQYHYIVANPFAVGEKMRLDSIDDGTDYSKVHAYYHPRLQNIMRKFEFYDLFLVNVETGDIVYSVTKEVDYASNLDHGPFRRSNLADALTLVRQNNERGVAQLIDFALYRPSYGAPAAFWVAPLYNGRHLVGVLMAQVSLEAINAIMTTNERWTQVGLGRTGEAYLVGSDRLLRTDVRPRIEDPVGYQENLTALGVSARTVDLIRKFDTAVLLQEIATPAVAAALQNQEGMEFTTNYLQRPVLSAYQPLALAGLQWALIVEMDADEAFAPIYRFQRSLLITVVLIIVVLAFLSIGIAQRFFRPVNRLVVGSHSLRQADGSVDLAAFQINAASEWDELAAAFREWAQYIHHQTALLVAKETENGQLLQNLLPGVAVQRLQQRKVAVVDQVSQVTVCNAQLEGVATLTQKSGPEVAILLQDLFSDLDEAAARHDVEYLITPDQQIIAFCGLSTPHLDHSRRIVDFALALQALVQRLDTRHTIKITLHGGIHSGPLTGSVLYKPKIVYEVWGDSVATALELSGQGAPDRLLVSQTIYEQLHEQYCFQLLSAPPKGQRLGQRGNGQAQVQATAWLLTSAKTARNA